MRLQGKVAWVTGSSRGIGAAIAKLFAAEGARVAIHGRDVDALAKVRAEIVGDVTTVQGDLTKLADVVAMHALIEKELGPLDIVVANAGASMTKPAPLEEIPEDGWRASVDTNLTATFFTLKTVLPGMKQRKSGNIITMSSAAARRPSPHSPIPYAAAKAGIELLTQDVAAQAGPFGIRANCISPETILTERTTRQIPDATKQQLLEQHPIRRLGVPDDVAQAALFLASDASSWITGIILDVAGGSVLA
jgi:3-oxoacyl-[acyl-carrier protein] reductase